MTRQRHRKNIIIFTLLIIVLVMTIGYSSLSQYLTINGTSNITSDFKVVFTNVVEGTLNKATTETLDKTETQVTFTTVLRAPGSSAEYIVTVQNQGKLDAYLESIEGIDEANSQEPSYVRFKVKDLYLNDRLNVGESKTFRVIVTYDVAATELSDVEKTLTLKLNFTQNSGNAPAPIIGNAVEYLLASKVDSTVADGSSGLVALDNSGEITTSSSPREYRYIGPNPNNYVYFNTYSSDEYSVIVKEEGHPDYTYETTSTSEECEVLKQQAMEDWGTNGITFECVQTVESGQSQLWRIIGIFDGKIKLIKDSPISSQLEWDINGSNDWTTASLQQLLNSGDYYNATGSYASSGLTTEARQMIDTVTWKLGGSNTEEDVTAQMFYERERGTDVYSGRPTEWVGQVGLMYASDYGFATSGGATTGRSACLANSLYNWNSVEDCYTNNWLYDSLDWQWTLTNLTSAYGGVFYVHSGGIVYVNGASFIIGGRPSLNLKTDTVFVSGTGTKEDPYVIG